MLAVLVRVLSLWVAILFAWLAHERFMAFASAINQSGRLSTPSWFLYVGVGVLSGIFLGFAILTLSFDRYRFRRSLLLGAFPGLLLAAELVFLRFYWILWDWTITLVYSTRIVLAVILGSVIISGFAREIPPSESGD